MEYLGVYIYSLCSYNSGSGIQERDATADPDEETISGTWQLKPWDSMESGKSQTEQREEL